MSFTTWLISAAIVLGSLWLISSFMNAEKERKELESKQFHALVESKRNELESCQDGLLAYALRAQEYGYRPKSSELLLSVQERATRLMYKSTGRYVSHSISYSPHRGSPIRYRASSGRIQTEKDWVRTGDGRLLVTSQALIFESELLNERISWQTVANVDVCLDGFRVFKRTGPPRKYFVSSPDPMFAAMVEVMLSRHG